MRLQQLKGERDEQQSMLSDCHESALATLSYPLGNSSNSNFHFAVHFFLFLVSSFQPH